MTQNYNERQKQLLQKIAEKKKYSGNPLTNWYSNRYSWQNELISMTNDHDILGALACNQGGKTITMMGMVAYHLLGDYPEDWSGRKWDKEVTIVAAGLNSDLCRDPLMVYLLGTANRMEEESIGTGFIPKDRFVEEACIKEKGGIFKQFGVRHKNGGVSKLIFKSYEQGHKAAQGFRADIVVIDEQPPVEFWAEISKRILTTNGIALCSFTPLHGFTTMVENFWRLPNTGGETDKRTGTLYTKEQIKKDPELMGFARMGMIRAAWSDVTHITEQQKATILAQQPSYKRKAVSEGYPVAGTGRVYPIDIDKISYEPGDVKINKHWRHLIGIDIGYGADKDPSAGVLAIMDEANDTIYIEREFKENTSTHEELSNYIWSLNPTVPVVYPRDSNKVNLGNATTTQALITEGVKMLAEPFHNPIGADGKKNIHLSPGFIEINSRLQSGRLKINRDCWKLLREMSEYVYDNSGKPASGSHDHVMDALRYTVMTIIQGHGALPGNREETNYDDIDTDEYLNY